MEAIHSAGQGLRLKVQTDMVHLLLGFTKREREKPVLEKLKSHSREKVSSVKSAKHSLKNWLEIPPFPRIPERCQTFNSYSLRSRNCLC